VIYGRISFTSSGDINPVAYYPGNFSVSLKGEPSDTVDQHPETGSALSNFIHCDNVVVLFLLSVLKGFEKKLNKGLIESE